MSVSTNDHLTFLLSCIQHANIGKIDFAAVAQDCNIVTKEAAAKRYSRLVKSVRDGTGSSSPSKMATVTADTSLADGDTAEKEKENDSKAQGKPGRKRKIAATTGVPRKRGRPAKVKIEVPVVDFEEDEYPEALIEE